VTSNIAAKMGLQRRPYAFTEQGVAMLSSVLNSERAVQVNIAIMRAFVRLREILSTHMRATRGERKNQPREPQFSAAGISSISQKPIMACAASAGNRNGSPPARRPRARATPGRPEACLAAEPHRPIRSLRAQRSFDIEEDLAQGNPTVEAAGQDASSIRVGEAPGSARDLHIRQRSIGKV
jgi:hypothetical protein